MWIRVLRPCQHALPEHRFDPPIFPRSPFPLSLDHYNPPSPLHQRSPRIEPTELPFAENLIGSLRLCAGPRRIADPAGAPFYSPHSLLDRFSHRGGYLPWSPPRSVFEINVPASSPAGAAPLRPGPGEGLGLDRGEFLYGWVLSKGNRDRFFKAEMCRCERTEVSGSWWRGRRSIVPEEPSRRDATMAPDGPGKCISTFGIHRSPPIFSPRSALMVVELDRLPD